jgi:hypothetical protein
VNVRGEVQAYLVPEVYRRLRLEALARGISRSRCAGDCLAEYFALRQEMATAFGCVPRPRDPADRVCAAGTAHSAAKLKMNPF